MATYLVLNLAIGGATLSVLGFMGRLRFDRYVVFTCAVLVIFTAIFDTTMIDAGLFTYNPEKISGLRLGSAPLEDFFYALLAGILIPSIWRKQEKSDAK